MTIIQEFFIIGMLLLGSAFHPAARLIGGMLFLIAASIMGLSK